MDMFNGILRNVSEGLKNPVIIILILLLILTVFLCGQLVCELLVRHRKFKVKLPVLLDELEKDHDNSKKIISESSLFECMKKPILNILEHPEYPNYVRNALCENTVEEISAKYSRIIKITDTISRIAPMFGLLGTLIPLGPGIIALGQGDTFTLSGSLLTAFDTTVAGLVCAAAAIIISSIRKSIYNKYMGIFEAIVECIRETENKWYEESKI
ncbi:MAG: MotA/TolQ/ExbB proton channel family protein [Clostridiales bacterium]|nr:MotA/TolQ/ExbB proton channel family protein [Clostridiales bacterium]